jgi:hypothetical protein
MDWHQPEKLRKSCNWSKSRVESFIEVTWDFQNFCSVVALECKWNHRVGRLKGLKQREQLQKAI